MCNLYVQNMYNIVCWEWTCLVDRRSLRSRGCSSWGASERAGALAPRAAAAPPAAAAAPARRCAVPGAAPLAVPAASSAPAACTGCSRSRSGSWHTHTIKPHSMPTGPLDISPHISPISFYSSPFSPPFSPLYPLSSRPEATSLLFSESFFQSFVSHEWHLLSQWNVSRIVFDILIVNVQPDLR